MADLATLLLAPDFDPERFRRLLRRATSQPQTRPPQAPAKPAPSAPVRP